MSLRLALKRSLQDSTTSSINTEQSVTTTKPLVNRRIFSSDPAPVLLPPITKCIRNHDPSAIDRHGFVEVSDIFSPSLLGQIRQEADIKLAYAEFRGGFDVEEISNALQLSVSEGLRREMTEQIRRRDVVSDTVSFVFGRRDCNGCTNYNGYAVESPKVLVTLPGKHPQHPHADDFCTSCVLCLIHLKDGQLPTRVERYRGGDFPTGITVECDECGRESQLSDEDFRRGVHLTDEGWRCRCCEKECEGYDFEGKLVEAFGSLIGRDGPNLCDAYIGKREVVAGDGYLALPTLIHRGPGNASSSQESRYMLFFTLRPTYNNLIPNPTLRVYDPDQQIHASAVLYNQFKKVKSIYESNGCALMSSSYSAVQLLTGKKVATLMRENEELKDLVLYQKKQLAKKENEEGFATLMKENDELRAEVARLKRGAVRSVVSRDDADEMEGEHASTPRVAAVDVATNRYSINAPKPTRLATNDDVDNVNKLHQYVRRELLEIFVVSSEDHAIESSEQSEEESPSKSEKRRKTTRDNVTVSHEQTANTSHLYPGRIGLRCVHCATHPGQKKSVFYPRCLSGIYREVCAWQRLHFQVCKHVPRAVKKRYEHYKNVDATRGKVKYWELSAKAIGLVDNPHGSNGVVFA